MKALDVCNQLAKFIPRFTDGFSESIDITSITPTGDTALVVTASPHGLSNGDNTAIIFADAPVEIDTSTFLRVVSTATFETLQDHDLTLSERDKAAGGKTITISGATETEFNGTFQLLSVLNRRKLVIAVTDAGPTTISGSPIVEDANGGVFNGLFTVANVTATKFEYTLPISYPLPAAVTNAKAQTELRIATVLDVNQFIDDIYTKELVNDDLLIVQLGDVSQSKKRNEESDASDSSSAEYSYTPILIQTFSIYIFMNVTEEVEPSALRDKVESEYVPAIYRSVLRAKFDTGFTFSQHRTTFTGHGVFAFGNNDKGKALYVHEISFEQLAILDKVADTVGPEDNVAMRDVSFTLPTSLGTGVLTASVDLDEEPIP